MPVPGGAEDGAYGSSETARRTANTLMSDVSELRVVAGMTPAYYTRIRPYVCALPVTDLSMINVNTLRIDQAPLLSMLLTDLDPARAAQAIDARPMLGWDSLATFWNLPPLTATPPADDIRNQVKLTTRWFDLAITVELADAEFEEHALIDAALKPAKLARRSYGEPS
ncbi:MAG: type II secretion system minor pseudopilin GspK [Sphingomonadales bacterium]